MSEFSECGILQLCSVELGKLRQQFDVRTARGMSCVIDTDCIMSPVSYDHDNRWLPMFNGLLFVAAITATLAQRLEDQK